MKWYLKVLRQYADFSGRARRKEYWMFVLFNVIVVFAFSILYGLALGLNDAFESAKPALWVNAMMALYSAAIFLPSLAVGVRRLHDIGKSGWMYLIALIPVVGGIWLLVLMATEGGSGENRYGTDPKLYDGFGEKRKLKSAAVALVIAGIADTLIVLSNIPFIISYPFVVTLYQVIIPIIISISLLAFAGVFLSEKNFTKKTVTFLLIFAGVWTLVSIYHEIGFWVNHLQNGMPIDGIITQKLVRLAPVTLLILAIALFLKKNRNFIRNAAVFLITVACLLIISHIIWCANSLESLSPGENSNSVQQVISYINNLLSILLPVSLIVLSGLFLKGKKETQEDTEDAKETDNVLIKCPSSWSLQTSGGSKYYSQNASSLYAASESLKELDSIPPQTYYLVDTPDGTLGRDINGFFTEAAIKTNNLRVENPCGETGFVQPQSLTMFGDMTQNQNAVALLKKHGQYAKLILMMKCGKCGYESPIETDEGNMERQCYSCGILNKTHRGGIRIYTGTGIVDI
jgi:uncharacterized membrane protein YhaH (DUF805 family)